MSDHKRRRRGLKHTSHLFRLSHCPSTSWKMSLLCLTSVLFQQCCTFEIPHKWLCAQRCLSQHHTSHAKSLICNSVGERGHRVDQWGSKDLDCADEWSGWLFRTVIKHCQLQCFHDSTELPSESLLWFDFYTERTKPGWWFMSKKAENNIQIRWKLKLKRKTHHSFQKKKLKDPPKGWNLRVYITVGWKKCSLLLFFSTIVHFFLSVSLSLFTVMFLYSLDCRRFKAAIHLCPFSVWLKWASNYIWTIDQCKFSSIHLYLFI